MVQVQQPTLVLWGRQDTILELAYAERFERTLPNGRLVWIEDCGHCGQLGASMHQSTHAKEAGYPAAPKTLLHRTPACMPAM